MINQQANQKLISLVEKKLQAEENILCIIGTIFYFPTKNPNNKKIQDSLIISTHNLYFIYSNQIKKITPIKAVAYMTLAILGSQIIIHADKQWMRIESTQIINIIGNILLAKQKFLHQKGSFTLHLEIQRTLENFVEAESHKKSFFSIFKKNDKKLLTASGRRVSFCTIEVNQKNFILQIGKKCYKAIFQNAQLLHISGSASGFRFDAQNYEYRDLSKDQTLYWKQGSEGQRVKQYLRRKISKVSKTETQFIRRNLLNYKYNDYNEDLIFGLELDTHFQIITEVLDGWIYCWEYLIHHNNYERSLMDGVQTFPEQALLRQIELRSIFYKLHTLVEEQSQKNNILCSLSLDHVYMSNGDARVSSVLCKIPSKINISYIAPEQFKTLDQRLSKFSVHKIQTQNSQLKSPQSVILTKISSEKISTEEDIKLNQHKKSFQSIESVESFFFSTSQIYKINLWKLGMLLYELAYRKLPFPVEYVAYKVKHHEHIKVHFPERDGHSIEFHHFLKSLICKDPTVRGMRTKGDVRMSALNPHIPNVKMFKIIDNVTLMDSEGSQVKIHEKCVLIFFLILFSINTTALVYKIRLEQRINSIYYLERISKFVTEIYFDIKDNKRQQKEDQTGKMLRFESQYLREILIDNSDRAIMEYCNICYYELKKYWPKKSNLREQSSVIQNSQAWFLLRTMSELSLIFKDKAQSPMLKFKSTKLITYLLLMNEPQIYKKFELQLFPLIKNICYYNKSLRIQERGYDFFKKNKYFDVANVEQRQKIKIIGSKFVIFCLQVVYMMSKWMPLQVANRKELTSYGQAYEDLIKEGVRFPEEEDLMFFNEIKINQILKNVQKSQSLVKDNRFSIHSTKLVKYNAANHSNLSNEGSVSNYSQLPSNLQKQIQEKEEIINEYRQQMEQLKQQKQFLIKQFDSEKEVFKRKMLEYETELRKLYYEVKYLRKKLRVFETDESRNDQQDKQSLEITEMLLFESSVESQRSDMMDLKQKIRLLIQQNMRLKEQNIKSQKRINQNEGELFVQSRKKMNQINMNKIQLIQELLKNDCQENKQFNFYGSTSKHNHENIQHKIKKKNQIFNQIHFLPIQQQKNTQRLNKVKSQQALQKFKNAHCIEYLTIFQPYYCLLNTQLKNRLKKCLLKFKQILYKDSYLQIGIRTSKNDEITLLQQIIITNITKSNQKINSLKNITIEIINNNRQQEIILIPQKLTKIKENKHQRNQKKITKDSHLCFNIKNLFKDQQHKFEIKIQINNINFQKGIFARISYEKQQIVLESKQSFDRKSRAIEETINMGLILPVSKIKLVQFLPKASRPLQFQKSQNNKKKHQGKQQHTLMKLFYLNHKVLESLSKLVKYFGEDFAYVENYHNQKIPGRVESKLCINKEERSQIGLRVKFMDKIFSIQFGYVSQNNNLIPELLNGARQLQIQPSRQGSGISEYLTGNKLVKMIINYEKTTPLVLADYLASQFVFILSIN